MRRNMKTLEMGRSMIDGFEGTKSVGMRNRVTG